jgi:hypothetical protein
MKDGKSTFEYSGKANNKINYILSKLKKHPDSNLFYVVGSNHAVFSTRSTMSSKMRMKQLKTLINRNPNTPYF